MYNTKKYLQSIKVVFRGLNKHEPRQARLMPICVLFFVFNLFLKLFIGNNGIFVEINLTKEKDFNSTVILSGTGFYVQSGIVLE